MFFKRIATLFMSNEDYKSCIINHGDACHVIAPYIVTGIKRKLLSRSRDLINL